MIQVDQITVKMKISYVFVFLLQVQCLFACDSSTKSFHILDITKSSNSSAQISALLNLYNVTGQSCFEECCKHFTKDHCNVATFMPKSEVTDANITETQVLGNCSLMSCVPLSSCHFTVSTVPCYSILLSPSHNSSINNEDVSDIFASILKAASKFMSHSLSTEQPDLVLSNKTMVDVKKVTSSINASSLDYSNGSAKEGGSRTKPRKGVEVEPGKTPSELHNVTKTLSGSKPRKGVSDGDVPTTAIVHGSTTEETLASASLDVMDVTVSPEPETFKADKEQYTPETPGASSLAPDTTTITHKTTPKSISTTSKLFSQSVPNFLSNRLTKANKTHTSTTADSRNVEKDFVQTGNSQTKDPNSRVLSPHLIIAVILGILLVVTVIGLVTRAMHDSWQKRHYRRMDFLIDGMYDN